MNFFKHLVVLSAIFLGSNLNAMERTTFHAHVSQANNDDSDDKSYSFNQSDSGFSFSVSFNTNCDRSVPQEPTYTSNEHQDDHARTSRCEDMAAEQANKYDSSNSQDVDKTKNSLQDLDQNNVKSQVKAIVHTPLIEAIDELANDVKSPTYQAKIVDQIMSLKNQMRQCGIREYCFGNLQKQSDFLDALLDGSINQMITTIQKGDLKEARKAFDQLKKMWPWDHHGSFLIDLRHTSTPREFIKLIGSDIMQIAEGSLVSRKDYLDSYDKSFAGNLARYQRVALSKQLQGDMLFLQKEVSFLSSRLLTNPNSNACPLEKAMLVTVKSILANPITHIFSTIKNANFDVSTETLGNFQMQCLWHFEGEDYKTMGEASADMIERHGIDLLSMANKCYKSRSDYQEKSAQQKTTHNNEQKIDNLDKASTTISQNTLTTTPESNQRIIKILDTLNDQAIEKFSRQIDVVGSLLQKQNLDTESHNKHLMTCLQSHVLLQQYAENPHKHIVMQQDKNTALFNARKNALNIVAQNPLACRDQTYLLSLKSQNLLQSHGIDIERFTYCYGNAAQRLLHSEFVEILNESSLIQSNMLTQPILDMATICAYTGSVYAQQNNLEQAFKLADCAWASLDCAKVINDDEVNIAQQAYTDIAEGILEGCINAISNTAHIVTHPRETLSNIGSTFAHLGFCLMDVMSSTDDDFLAFNLDNHKTIEENAQKRQEKVAAIVNAVKQTTLKGATSFVTEQIVLGQITGLGIDVIKHYAKPSLAQLAKIGRALNDKAADKAPKIVSAFRKQVADKLGNFTKTEHVAVTAEGVKVTVTNAQKEAQVLQSMEKTGETIKKANNPSHINEKKPIDSRNNGKVVSSSANSAIQHEAEALLAKEKTVFIELEKTKQIVPNKTRPRSLSHGLDADGLKKLEKYWFESELEYEKIRSLNNDVVEIAKNINISEGYIAKIKEHVFYNIHELSDGIKRFAADGNMAAAWNRLINGNFTSNDLILLQHEYTELTLMNELKMNYSSAHAIADKSYNWYSTLLKG